MVPITGTPYCNGNQDLATLMAYVDPGHSASRKDWWDRITAKRVLPDVVEGLRDWREDYLIVRKKDVVLKGKIPPKFIEIIPVTPYMIELSTYEQEEERFLKIAENFRDVYDDNPLAKQRLLELFACAMACLANMRKYLLHSLLEEGRQISQQFSPSRAHMLSREQKPKECVCCKAFRDEKKDETKAPSGEDSKPPARRRRRSTTDWNMDLDDDQLNDEEFELDDEDDEDAAKGPIIALPSDVCDWSDSPCKHFAHEKCIADLREDGKSCPCCAKMPALVHLEQTMITLDGDEGESKQTGSISVSHPTYCQNIQVSPGIPGGFKASAKVSLVRLSFVLWLALVRSTLKHLVNAHRFNALLSGFRRWHKTKRLSFTRSSRVRLISWREFSRTTLEFRALVSMAMSTRRLAKLILSASRRIHLVVCSLPPSNLVVLESILSKPTMFAFSTGAYIIVQWYFEFA